MFKFSEYFYINKKALRALAMACALAVPMGGAALAEPVEEPVPLEAVLGAVPVTAEAEVPAEVLDDQRDSVRQAQRRLIELGLLSGSADGVCGPMTGDALRTYQAQNGLEATGHLDAVTLERLTRVDKDALDARDVQQRLIDLGYLQGTADGVIGPRSIAALEQFQRMNGLEANGKANKATLEALYGDDVIALPDSLSQGSKGEAVGRLQRRLAQFGFFEGEVDESYGQSTANAVAAFQRHLIAQGHGEEIVDDGTASPMTQYCLFAEDYSSYLRDVTPGVSDSEAERIERRLYELGYTDLPADDVLDDDSVAALMLFKADAEVDTPDATDQATIDALFAKNAPKAEFCVPHAIAKGDSGQVVRDVEEALVRGGMMTKMPTGKYSDAVEKAVERLYGYLVSQKDPNAPLFADSKALSADAVERLVDGLLSYRAESADDSEVARRVQSRLYTLLYLDKSGVDGHLGSDSRAALKSFQSANGLKTTGRADGDTLDLLFTTDAKANPFPYRVEVSIDEQRVRVYKLNDRGQYDLEQTFTCSTGLHDSTPRGVFLDGHPVNRWHHFEKFNCWAQYSFEVTGDIMFHSVIYGSNTEGSLRSGSLYALGNPASHGCIRLTVDDAKWLYEHCKRGTVAIVIY